MANFQTGTIDYDNLVLTTIPTIIEARILADGETVKRGQALELDGGKMKAVDQYFTDINAIAADDAAADGADGVVYCYVFGAFNAGAVEDASAATFDLTALEAARGNGLYITRTVPLV